MAYVRLLAGPVNASPLSGVRWTPSRKPIRDAQIAPESDKADRDAQTALGDSCYPKVAVSGCAFCAFFSPFASLVHGLRDSGRGVRLARARPVRLAYTYLLRLHQFGLLRGRRDVYALGKHACGPELDGRVHRGRTAEDYREGDRSASCDRDARPRAHDWRRMRLGDALSRDLAISSRFVDDLSADGVPASRGHGSRGCSLKNDALRAGGPEARVFHSSGARDHCAIPGH